MTDTNGSYSSLPPARLSMISIGSRVRAERQRLGLTLEELSARSGSSRSMLSAIERGDKVPSVLVLDQIANTLGVSVSRLLARETAGKVSVIRRDDQEIVEDHGGGEGTSRFRRRVTSPVLPGVDFEMGRLEIDANVDAGVFSPHAYGWAEYVVVEQGTLEVTLDGTTHKLKTGDAIYFASDCEHAYKNVGDDQCVAYIVMTGSRKRQPAPLSDE